MRVCALLKDKVAEFFHPLQLGVAFRAGAEMIAGSCPAVLRAVHLIEELGPALGLHVNLATCELFREGQHHIPT